MYLTVSPLHDPGSIPGQGGVFRGVLPWLTGVQIWGGHQRLGTQLKPWLRAEWCPFRKMPSTSWWSWGDYGSAWFTANKHPQWISEPSGFMRCQNRILSSSSTLVHSVAIVRWLFDICIKFPFSFVTPYRFRILAVNKGSPPIELYLLYGACGCKQKVS